MKKLWKWLPWIAVGAAGYAAAGIGIKYSQTGTSQGLFNVSDIALWPYVLATGQGWTIKPGVMAGG